MRHATYVVLASCQLASVCCIEWLYNAKADEDAGEMDDTRLGIRLLSSVHPASCAAEDGAVLSFDLMLDNTK